MLEAMSCGCTLVGSDTPPVREVIRHNDNGLLVDFFSPQNIADTVEEALSDAELRRRLGQNARETVITRFDAQKLLPLHWRVLQEAAAGR